MRTDLDAPKWNYTLIVDGVEKSSISSEDSTLDISGFNLSYLAPTDESILVTLEGRVPTVSETTNKTIINIYELDCCAIHQDEIHTVLVINPTELKQKISDVKKDLKTFGSHIDEKAAMGVNTTAAEIKYIEAQRNSDSAYAHPPTQYAEAIYNLNAAQAAIDEGEKALDEAWAESEIENAQCPITNADIIIGWFKGSNSTAGDPALPGIIAKRNIAVQYLSAAEDKFAEGNYSAAREEARKAFETGNESYNDALKNQSISLCTGCDGDRWFFMSFIAPGIGALVLLLGGIVLWRKRARA